ncbi:MAG: thioredoxin family protein [Comamonadaceae bacterium]|nr:thioredoxin family protein [Comamonadaceae bacterium]
MFATVRLAAVGAGAAGRRRRRGAGARRRWCWLAHGGAGRFGLSQARRARAGAGSALAAAPLALYAVFAATWPRRRAARDVAQAASRRRLGSRGAAPSSEAQVAAGKPVFVDFTAAWCVTCQANKRLVLNERGGARGVRRARRDAACAPTGPTATTRSRANWRASTATACRSTCCTTAGGAAAVLPRTADRSASCSTRCDRL